MQLVPERYEIIFHDSSLGETEATAKFPEAVMEFHIHLKDDGVIGSVFLRRKYTFEVSFFTGESTVIFRDSEYQTPNGWSTEKVIFDLLWWISLPTDAIEDSYFVNYSQTQLAWAESSECEQVNSLIDEIGEPL